MAEDASASPLEGKNVIAYEWIAMQRGYNMHVKFFPILTVYIMKYNWKSEKSERYYSFYSFLIMESFNVREKSSHPQSIDQRKCCH